MSDINASTEVSTKRSFEGSDSQQGSILTEVASALSGLKYGEITIIVRRGKVVEIERTSRNRPELKG